MVLVVLTIGPRLPLTRRWVTMGYRTWKRTHRLIGIFFVFACAHTFLVRPLVVDTVIPFGLVLGAFGVGIASYLCDLFLARFVRPSRRYSVAEAKRLDDTTIEVVLVPRKKPLEHEAGQFVFVSFSGRRLRESHPFTVASSPRDESLQLLIKASRDFTRRLHERLEAGTKARVEGSYGMLDHRRGGPRQIWIAGGIGITPFLSWLRHLYELDAEIDLFYAVRGPDQALFADEIEERAASHHDLRFHLNISERDGSLSIEGIESVTGDLADVTVYMCGPVPMIEAFEGAFIERGVHRRDIHYEGFAFR